jgi:DNA (cytosine-5)-methyltransferase 1
VDTTKTITHIGLCAGYGGIELGLKRVIPSMRSVALCEIEAFAIANLVAKMEAGLMEPAPIWTDLKTFPWSEFRGRVDILTGGYPCQPFSAAGKRLGTDDPRHLWPFIASGIRILQPRMCFLENVEGHISLGLSTVISDLEELGYKVSWGIFSASECIDASGRTAPHQRKRVFILAHLSSERLERYGAVGIEKLHESHSEKLIACGNSQNVWPSRPGEPQHAWEPPRVVENSKFVGRRGRCDGDAGGLRREIQTAGSCGGGAETMGNAIWIHEHKSCGGNTQQHESWNASEAMGNPDSRRLASGINAGSGTEADGGGKGDFEQAESGKIECALGRDINGSSDRMDYAELCISGDNRTDELRLLGNGVVPATATRAFLTLLEELNK